MPAVVVKSALRATQDANITMKALQQFTKTCHFPAGTVQILVVAKFFR
jgi:hypothetical protein